MYSSTPSHDRAESRQKPKSPRNYFRRKEQYRLFLLVGSVMLVLIAMSEAKNPENWSWLFHRGDEATEVRNERSTRVASIDPPTSTVPDAFISEPDLPEVLEEEESGDYFPGVHPSLLSTVRDARTFKNSELSAWANLWGVLADANQSDLEAASKGMVTYWMIDEQPNSYRGRIVTIRGAVKQVIEIDKPGNKHGPEHYCRYTLLPEGSSSDPILIYCLELPENFPRTEKIHEEATFTGFFYKRLAYEAGDGARVAPVILAKSIDWELSAIESVELPGLPLVLASVLGIGLLATLIAGSVYWKSRSLSAQAVKYNLSQQGDKKALDALAEQEFPSGLVFPDDGGDVEEQKLP